MQLDLSGELAHGVMLIIHAAPKRQRTMLVQPIKVCACGEVLHDCGSCGDTEKKSGHRGGHVGFQCLRNPCADNHQRDCISHR